MMASQMREDLWMRVNQGMGTKKGRVRLAERYLRCEAKGEERKRRAANGEMRKIRNLM